MTELHIALAITFGCPLLVLALGVLEVLARTAFGGRRA